MGKFGPLLLIHPKYLGALRNHGNSAAGPNVICAWCFGLKAATGVLSNMHVFWGGRKVKHPGETHDLKEHKVPHRKAPFGPGRIEAKAYFM